MGIEPGDEVRLEYVGRLSDGTVFDTSKESVVGTESAIPDSPSPPLRIEVGAERVVRGPGRIVDELESHLHGLEESESATVTVPPEKAYGPADEEKVVTYDRESIKQMMGQEVSAGAPAEGMTVRTPEGRIGHVVDVGDESLRVDFNHRLAGESLTFEVTVAEIE